MRYAFTRIESSYSSRRSRMTSCERVTWWSLRGGRPTLARFARWSVWLYSNVPSLAAREHVPVFQRYNEHKVRFHPAKIFDTMEGEQIPYS